MTLRIAIVGMAVISFAWGVAFEAAHPAFADEAFLCGPDTVIYVKPEELELKKRTDPCVAAYYGLKVDPNATQPPTSAARPTNANDAKGAAVAAPSSAAKSQAARKAIEGGTSSNSLGLKRLPANDGESTSDNPREERSASLSAPPQPVPGTDFRNVRVLNATSPDEEWFKHQR